MLLSCPSWRPSVNTAATRPSPSLTALNVGWPAMVPPPCRTANVTGTPASRLCPSSVTIAMNGSGNGSPTAPICPLPVSTSICVGVPDVADSVNSAGPSKPVAVASTTLFPTPARVPSRSDTTACPCALVVTANVPSAALPLTSPALFSVTRNTTGTPVTGCPRALNTPATSGCANTEPAGPVCPDPETTRTSGVAASVRITTICVVAALPDRSVATT
jgi:hypothetical protein